MECRIVTLLLLTPKTVALIRLLSFALFLILVGCAEVTPKAPPPPPYADATVQAQALATNHASLTGAARRDNSNSIEQLLSTLDDATLAHDAAKLPMGDPLYNFAGRLLLRRGLPLPHPFNRSAVTFGADNRPAVDTDGYRPPRDVAILLPLTGSQAAAATAVRDGYLSGYYSETRQRPAVHFYDTTSGVKSAYARAVAEGRDVAIGPLAREDVDLLFANEVLDIPLLALNRGNHIPPEGSAAFSLSPEDEGISLAQYLIERGSKQVLLISGNEDAQRRTADAAKEQLQRRGVQLVAALPYQQQMTAALEPLAQSNPPDAILLVLKAPQARALVPQLALANLASIPRIASSHITSGTGTASEDMALDGIIFPTEPWLTQRVGKLPSLTVAAARVDSAKGPSARLFAFGYDAWLLTAYLEHLAQQPNAELSGATGQLSLDGFGNILRRPAWSRFVAGVPQPMRDDAR
jgi:uncharacterized protein